VKLRSVFADQFPDDAFYSQAFDGAEPALGVLSQDLGEEERRRNPDTPGWLHPGSSWFGRATYTSRWSRRSPVDDLAHEAAAAGTTWAPLTVGLFGADGCTGGGVRRGLLTSVQYSASEQGVTARENIDARSCGRDVPGRSPSGRPGGYWPWIA
jgi:hypothetical protein